MHQRYPTKIEVIVLGKKLCKTPKHAAVYPKRDETWAVFLSWLGSWKREEQRDEGTCQGYVQSLCQGRI